MKDSDDIFECLRFRILYIVVNLALVLSLSAFFQEIITRRWVNQRLVPRLHPVTLKPGDWIETGSHGADRPVLIRHADGTVTNAGQMRGGFLRYFHQTPSFFAWVFVSMPLVILLYRLWPRVPTAIRV